MECHLGRRVICGGRIVLAHVQQGLLWGTNQTGQGPSDLLSARQEVREEDALNKWSIDSSL